ncbi:uncharacterized protein PAC_03289 [Phialocephala subalpina]|uniref:Clr5 domain-containing protein n=1 Tax=Phialocephala subalpina TaxID=576137 RepID=A0A1L7WKV6_9HELO|nr:uncharacterized protein PAC_03289 [Phialocephala subalpina]
MATANKVSRIEVPHARQRLPRKAKGRYLVPITDIEVTEPELTGKSVNVLKHRIDGDAPTNMNDKTFEFVTLTSEPTSTTLRETSKQVRKQAMHDYLRKQNQQSATGVIEVVESSKLQEHFQYKGKFKLNTWSHKTKTKAILARRERATNEEENVASQEEPVPFNNFSNSDTLTRINSWRPIERSGPLQRIFSPSASSLDPFDTLAIRLGPQSEKLLVHYSTVYTMNSVAINAEGNFFSFVKTDPALFHSILYLVALHHDLCYGLVDSPICLYHGVEAFRIINERLENNFVFDDVTIAAVAMLVNKENLSGRYGLSKMHMQGLKQMVQTRGGAQNLSGVFQRIVTWSDFCFSNVWNIQPSFPRLPSIPPTSPIPTSLSTDLESEQLKASHLLGASSPIIPIISNLRTLTHLLSSSNSSSHTKSARMHASDLIYDTEYSLLALNPPSLDPDSFNFALSNCAFTFESLPLRTALHLYLYLSIRLVPTSSELVRKMVARLRDALEEVKEWWESNEKKMWLLWILFVGAVATRRELEERWWFIDELRRLCTEMRIWDVQNLKAMLRGVLWEEEWCGEKAEAIWEEVVAQGKSMYEVDSRILCRILECIAEIPSHAPDFALSCPTNPEDRDGGLHPYIANLSQIVELFAGSMDWGLCMLWPKSDAAASTRPETNIFRTPKKSSVPYISPWTRDIPFMQSPCHYCDTVHLDFKDIVGCRYRYHYPVPPPSDASAVSSTQSITGGDNITPEFTHQDATDQAVDQGPNLALRSVANQPSKISRRTQKREKWASIKDEVHQCYVVQGMTLEKTMAAVEHKYSFKASLRKWKMQIKEWKFDKNISKAQMAILVAKAEKRARNGNKQTAFYYKGKEIRSEKLVSFQKRSMTERTIPASPSAATPSDTTYETPRDDGAVNHLSRNASIGASSSTNTISPRRKSQGTGLRDLQRGPVCG